ncbi:MAG: response regulator transcription factor [Oscillospiraceae bacterium]|jgi:DNA-binding response OmpR family regulator|nr:response regulator transcription factor [Oscillospiraceae bacterium]
MANILIVEDERSINDLILMNLRLVGHDGVQAFDGNEAVAALDGFSPDLVLLDVMLPYKDGFSLMEQNAFENIPVIFLTAKDSTMDKVRGLKLGADDYIVKPFEAVELLARVEAVLRRVKPAERSITVDSTSIHLDQRVVTVGGESVELTNREFELLEVLLTNRNIALSREKLLDLAWGYDYFGDTRTVDVHITKLRKKLGFENRIITVYKHGYRMEL